MIYGLRSIDLIGVRVITLDFLDHVLTLDWH